LETSLQHVISVSIKVMWTNRYLWKCDIGRPVKSC
jgi:hypothetical protein